MGGHSAGMPPPCRAVHIALALAVLGPFANAEDIPMPASDVEALDASTLGPRDRNPMDEDAHGIFQTPTGKTCMQRVEAVEAEHGVFDNGKMSQSAMTAIGGKLTKLCEGLFGRAKPDFET